MDDVISMSVGIGKKFIEKVECYDDQTRKVGGIFVGVDDFLARIDIELDWSKLPRTYEQQIDDIHVGQVVAINLGRIGNQDDPYLLVNKREADDDPDGPLMVYEFIRNDPDHHLAKVAVIEISYGSYVAAYESSEVGDVYGDDCGVTLVPDEWLVRDLGLEAEYLPIVLSTDI